MKLTQIAWEWNGEAMVPLRRFTKQADREFVIGQHYVLDPVEFSQAAYDKAYHANLRQIWSTLPERFDGQFPQYNDFRKWCLVNCGYVEITRIPCQTVKIAQAVLPHVIPPMFAIVHLEGTVIVITKPLSQRMRGGMPKEQRQQSYKDTLDYASSLIGVDASELESA